MTADSSVSEDDAMVSEAVFVRDDTAACTAAQRTLIQPSKQAAAGGLDIFVTDFATSQHMHTEEAMLQL